MRRLRFVPLLLAVIAWPWAAAAQEEGSVTGTVVVGGWDADVDDAAERAAEYETTEGGVAFGLDLERFVADGLSFSLSAEAKDADDQLHVLDFDVNRFVRSETEYVALRHRLIHEDVGIYAAATNHGRVVSHTDTDPEGIYGLDVSWLRHATEVQLPSLPALTMRAGYRMQERQGAVQHRTVSHCDTCHVVSQRRPVDETTEEASLEAMVAFARGSVRASYARRSFEEDVRNITLLFDNAIHPELRTPVFDNRLQWDSAEGPQAVDLRPSIDKDILKLQGNWAGARGLALTGAGVWTSTENQYTGLQSDYSGFAASAGKRFGRAWNLTWRGRYYTIDNDDVFVDVNARRGIAGPQQEPYYTYYPDAPGDFVRQSSLNRDVLESKLDARYRLGKKAGTLGLEWRFENVDRESLAVTQDGGTDTTTNVFGVEWSARPRTDWRVLARYRHAEVDDPFLAIDSGHSTLVSAAVPNPFHPNGAQYFESHDARIADNTAMPASWDEIALRTSYRFGVNTLSASYRYWDGDNHEGDLTDWSRTRQNAVLTLWSAPMPTIDWHVAWAWQEQELDLAASIPLFDG